MNYGCTQLPHGRNGNIKVTKLVLFGGTGQCRTIIDILKPCIDVIAIYDRVTIEPIKDVKIFNNRTKFENFCRENNEGNKLNFIVAIGGDHGWERARISSELAELGLLPLKLISPKAHISASSQLGEGIQILSNTYIGSSSQIGDYTIINNSSNVDHDCIVGRGCHLAPSSALAGNVSVGDYSFIGTNATILPNLSIGSNVTIGAGAVVTKNVSNNQIVLGCPARVVGENKVEIYRL